MASAPDPAWLIETTEAPRVCGASQPSSDTSNPQTIDVQLRAWDESSVQTWLPAALQLKEQALETHERVLPVGNPLVGQVMLH